MGVVMLVCFALLFVQLANIQVRQARALDRNPLHRFGTVEELANLASFLVSDGSAYINGEVIRMDGGEFLQGAGEFSNLGRVLTDQDWESLKPRKKK